MGGWDWKSGTVSDPKNKEGRTTNETWTGKGPITKEKELVKEANIKAIQDAKDAQEKASSQAKATISDKRRAVARSQSIFSINNDEQANLAKKYLLGG